MSYLCSANHRWPKLKMGEDDRISKHELRYQRRVVLQGSRFIGFVWEIHFRIKMLKLSYEYGNELHLTRHGVVFVSCVIWVQFVPGLGEFLVRCCSRCCFST